MSRYLKFGIFISYGFIGILLGVIIYNAITGSNLLNFLKGTRGSFFISAAAMLGTVCMLIGAISSSIQYQKKSSKSLTEIHLQQIDYLNKVLKENNQLSYEERENIEIKIKSLKNNT